MKNYWKNVRALKNFPHVLTISGYFTDVPCRVGRSFWHHDSFEVYSSAPVFASWLDKLVVQKVGHPVDLNTFGKLYVMDGKKVLEGHLLDDLSVINWTAKATYSSYGYANPHCALRCSNFSSINSKSI